MALFKKKIKPFTLTPEQKFLLVASRIFPRQDEIEEAAKLFEEVEDWDYIVQTAKEHGVAPILFDSANKHFQFKFPANVYAEFQRSYYTTLSQYHRRRKHFLKVVEALNKEGIVPILLKGIAMAEFYYPDPALRPMGDIDLLVHINDIPKTEDVMNTLGGKRDCNSEHEALSTIATNELRPFSFPTENIEYDIHWDIMPPILKFNFKLADIDGSCLQKSIESCEIKVLDHRDAIIFSYLHNEKNLINKGGSFRWYNDLRTMERHHILSFVHTDRRIQQSIDEHVSFYKAYFESTRLPKSYSNQYLHQLFFGKKEIEIQISTLKIILAARTSREMLERLQHYLFPPLKFMKEYFHTNSSIIAILYYPVRLFIKGFPMLYRFLKVSINDHRPSKQP